MPEMYDWDNTVAPMGRICSKCGDYHYSVVVDDRINVRCKNCGNEWQLHCPYCSKPVEKIERWVNGGGFPHVSAVCCGRVGLSRWNVLEKPRANLRHIAKERFDGKCANCGSRSHVEADHIVAIRNGGKDILSNMQLLCQLCHDKKTAIDCGGWSPKRCNIVQTSPFPLIELWERVKTAKDRGWTREQVGAVLRQNGAIWDRDGIVFCPPEKSWRLVACFSCRPGEKSPFIDVERAQQPEHCDGFTSRFVFIDGLVVMECSKCGAVFQPVCIACGKSTILPVEFVNSKGHKHIKAVCPCGQPNGEVSTGYRKNTKNRETSCRVCGSTEGLEKDHIIPISKGGADIVDNTQMLCGSCHDEKTVRDFPHWKPYPGWKPRGRS